MHPVATRRIRPVAAVALVEGWRCALWPEIGPAPTRCPMLRPMPPVRLSYLVAGLWPTIALGAMGCAGQSSETERQLQRMQERVAILQNERDRLDERVSALEQQQDLFLRERAQTQTSSLLQRPALKVVRLEPEPAEGAPAADAAGQKPTQVAAPEPNDGQRVLISGTGDKLTATQVPGGNE